MNAILIKNITRKTFGSVTEKAGQSNGADFTFQSARHALQFEQYKAFQYHSKQLWLNSVNDGNQIRCTVADGEERKEHEERFDILCCFGGGESLEQQDKKFAQEWS